jgi:flagellar protein FliL
MRMIIIAAVAVLALGGIGAGAYYYFNSSEAEASAPAAGGEHAQNSKSEGGHGEEGSDVEFVQLDPLILPVVDNDGFTQVVSLVVALEVKADKKEEIKRLSPRITDAFIQDMYGEMNNQSALKDGVLQVHVIKQRLNKITQKLLGKDAVQDVLLQVVQQRPA